MNEIFKKIIPRFLKRTLRWLRHIYFAAFDCLGEFVFRILNLSKPGWSQNIDKESIKKILLIRTDRIGDVVLTTPAIRAVRVCLPDSEIHLLIREYTKDLVINNINIDRILIDGKDSIARNYDLSIAFLTGVKPNYICYRSGAKYRLGYRGSGGSFFLTHSLIDDRHSRIRHEVESALEIVSVAGCVTQDKSLEVSVTGEGEEFAEDFFRKNSLLPNETIVAVHPGSRQKYIRWKKQGFAEVADRLIRELNVKVIILGSEDEIRLLEEIKDLMHEKPLFVTGLRLTCLVSLLKRCNLFIGNSTGTMHIAAALKVPVISIFGTRHPLDSYKAWRPWGEGHIVISKDLQCLNCHPSDCRDFRCLESITVQEVFDAAKAQLQKRQSNR